MEHIPMFDNLAVFIESKNINACPIAVTRPLLMAMEYDVVSFSNNTSIPHMLTGVILRHFSEVVNECRLSVSDEGIVLDVHLSHVLLNRFGGLALVEHQIIEGLHVLLVPFKFIGHR